MDDEAHALFLMNFTATGYVTSSVFVCQMENKADGYLGESVALDFYMKKKRPR